MHGCFPTTTSTFASLWGHKNYIFNPISVPHDFTSTLIRYTKQGLRVIAAATKSLPPKVQWKEADEMSRGALEEKAEFLGLIVMQNSIKPETFPAIKALHDADIITVMVTGKIELQSITLFRM